MSRLHRRDLLLGLAAISVASASSPLAAGRSSYVADTNRRMIDAVYGKGVRKPAHGLTPDSDDVAMYKEAVGWMKRRSLDNPLDPMGWAQHWAHHSIFCATGSFQFQVHYGWFFLPWHRAYLFNLEQKIRRLLQEPSFALPYWDWTRHPKVPAWYWGDDNPLHNATRLQDAVDVLPADFLETGPVMRARRFDHFGGRKRTPGDLQVEGTLEQSAHNNVHNWTGGELASFDGAGNDPLFQSHHGQIDRLWEAWLARGEGRANPDDPDWFEHVFWFYGAEGGPEYTFVRELLDIEALGYSYADLSVRPTLTEETTPVYAGDGLDFGEVDPDGALLAALEDLRDDMKRGGPGRASLGYERMSLPYQPFCHRLFFLPPDGEATYVGTFTILPIPDLVSGLERTVTSQVEVPPPALDALIAAGRVRVVGVPVPLKGRNLPEAPIPFGGVSLKIEV